MTSDRDILIRALETALPAWEEERRGKTLLRARPPGESILSTRTDAIDQSESILSPLSDAIDQSAAYKAVARHVLFPADSALVLRAPSLALSLLDRAEQAQWEGRDIGQAADWLIRVLSTRQADGTFTGVIWGLSIDCEAPLTKHTRLMPFAQLPDSWWKKLISERARKPPIDAAWRSRRYFDLPGAAMVRKVGNFPYISADYSPSFKTMAQLETEAHQTLLFLQGKVAGQPLALFYWFDFDDEDLNLDSYKNYVSWILPEIVPTIPANVAVNAATIQQELKALSDMPEDWRKDLLRSLERFTLSQCRHQTIDRILDLTLAFEIAVSGKGEHAPQRWKVSVRSAQMIGGSLPDRQEHRSSMAALYNLRNQGTHGSSLSGGGHQKQQKVVTEAAALYRKLLDSFWRHGARPCWNAIELGPISEG